MTRFALDEDFPESILIGLGLGIREAELVPIRKIDKRLRQMDDWKMLLSLHHLGNWDGLITMDGNMLKLPRELAVIHQTKLALVVIESSGHDPLRAAGLLLVHLPAICRKLSCAVGQIWKLNATAKNHEDPYAELAKLAKHQNMTGKKLYEENKLDKFQLRRNPLNDLPLG